MEERLVYTEKAGGSNPSSPTKDFNGLRVNGAIVGSRSEDWGDNRGDKIAISAPLRPPVNGGGRPGMAEAGGPDAAAADAAVAPIEAALGKQLASLVHTA